VAPVAALFVPSGSISNLVSFLRLRQQLGLSTLASAATSWLAGWLAGWLDGWLAG